MWDCSIIIPIIIPIMIIILVQDARVPVCPLCNQPVPVNRGDDPNIKVCGDLVGTG